MRHTWNRHHPIVMTRLSFKYLLTLVIAAVFGGACSDPVDTPTDPAVGDQTAESVYDSLLAAELGADQFGMGQYVMAFLKAGPNTDQDSTEAVELQKAHLANIRRLAEQGHLLLAGPFMDRGELRGIYIFDVPTVEEARRLTETDPAIRAGRLKMELRPWYGSAALRKLNEIHGRITKMDP